MTRQTTRAQGIAAFAAALGAAGATDLAPLQEGARSYLKVTYGTDKYLYAIKTCSHPSGLVMTAGSSRWVKTLIALADRLGLIPMVGAHSLATSSSGEQDPIAYRAAVRAGEQAYLAANPARRSFCLLAHGPDYMQPLP